MTREEFEKAYSAKKKKSVTPNANLRTAFDNAYKSKALAARRTALAAQQAEEAKQYKVNLPDVYKNDVNNATKGAAGYKLYEDALTEKANAESAKPWYIKLADVLATGNTTDTSLPTAMMNQAIAATRADESYKNPSSEWTDEERNAFGYLYAINPEEAYKYAEETNNARNTHKKQLELEKIKADATKDGGNMVVNALGAVAAGLTGGADYLTDLVQLNARGKLTTEKGISPFEWSQAVKEGIGTKLNQTYGTIPDNVWIFGGKGWGDVYQLGSSILESSAALAAGGPYGSLALFFGNAAAAGIDDAKARGASDDQALLYGTLLGVAEAGAEKIGIDNLLKVGKSGKTGFINGVKEVLKQAGAEGAEEGVTAVLGEVFDNMVMADKSNYNALVNEYMAQGMSRYDAEVKAVVQTMGDVIYDVVGGAVSGATHAAPVAVGSAIVNNRSDLASGRKIIDSMGAQSELYDAAEASDNSELIKLVQKAKKAQIGSNKEARLTGRLAQQFEKQYAEDTADYLTDSEIKRLGGDATAKTDYEAKAEKYLGKKTNAIKSETTSLLDSVVNYGTIEPSKKYTGETLAAYNKGLANYNGSPEAYALNFAIARSLGIKANGASFKDMLSTLSAEDQRGVTSLSDDTIIAAFEAGVKYMDGIKAAQARVENNRKKARSIEEEKQKKKASSEREETEITAEDNTDNVSVSTEVETMETEGKLNRTQTEAVKNIRKLAAYLPGYTFIIEAITEGGGNGYYDPATNTVHININAGRIGAESGPFDFALDATWSHEVGHSIKENAPQAYEELRQFIKDTFFKSEARWESAVKARLEQYRAQLGDDEKITYEYAEEEVVCNSLGKMLSSQRVMNELAAEHRSVFSRVWRAIKSFFDKIIKGITGNVEAGAYSYKSREERIVAEESKRKYAELEKMFVTALKAANEAAQAAKTIKYTADQKTAQNGENSALTNTNEQNVNVSGENNNKTPGVDNTEVKYSFGVTQAEINEYINKAYTKQNTEDYKPYAVVDQKLIDDVSSEIDIAGYIHALRDNDIRHIRNSHGESTNEKYPVTKVDLSKIPYIVSNYDKIYVKKNAKGIPGIVYVKVGEDDVIYYVEAVTQEYHSQKLLVNKQMIKTGINEIPNLYGLIDAINKNESSSQYLADLQKIRKAYVQDVKDNYSKNSIPDSEPKINPFGEKTSKKYSLSDREYMSAIERGDMEAAQAMVDEAARVAGYTDKLYHGTHQFGFTEFDPSYSDDKISLFVAGSPDISQTYSGRYGTRKISDAYKVDGLTIAEVVERLNKEAHESYDGEQLKIEYEIMYLQDVNRVINEVNDGVDWLSELVGKKIKEYAERMATDFDDKDAKTHKKLVELKEILDNYQYEYMSTPIYMLLHYTDAFDDGARVADLEYKIRLMNKLQNADTSNGVVVKKDLDGYGVSILYFDEAMLELKQRNAEGNYALYGNPRNQLVIDGGGQNWNDLRGWAKAIHHTLDNTVVERKGDYYRLYDKKTGNEIFHGRLAVNTYTEGLSARMRHIQMIEKSNNVLDARAEYHHTTRDIARFAKDLGYESVKFENIEDNGGQGESVGAGDVYAYFEPSNLKSADPVVYDDSGNVIPLSERFNPVKKDIRYSLPETDSNGRSLTAEQREFFAESQIRAVKKDGYTEISPEGSLLPVYHGTNTGEFYEFDKKLIGSANDSGWYGRGFYFAFSEYEAGMYGKNVLKCYLNIKNPFNFYEAFGRYDGVDSGDTNFDFASFVLNLADRFPEIAQTINVDIVKSFDSSGKADDTAKMNFLELADEIKELYNSERLTIEETYEGDVPYYEYKVSDNITNMDIPDALKHVIREHYITSATWAEYLYKDGTITKKQRDDIFDAMLEYGEENFGSVHIRGNFKTREQAQKNRLSAAMSYLDGKKYRYMKRHIPEYYMQRVGNVFSEELRRRGYDGVIQSTTGDEIVAFEANQIKLVSNKAPTESPDIRYSLTDREQRERLADAFYQMAESKEERAKVNEYRKELSKIDEWVGERDELIYRFKELKGVKGKSQERTEINARINALNDAIARHDSKLLKIAAAEPLVNVIKRYEQVYGGNKVMMSQGQLNKLVADYTKPKVYSKSDAEKAIKSSLQVAGVTAQKRNALIDELWAGMNSAATDAERVKIVQDMSTRVFDTIVTEAQMDNPDYEIYRERLDYLKQYVGRLTFTDDLMAEIKHKYDVDGTKAFLGRWGNKRSDGSSVSADVFVTDFARENAGYEYLEEMPVSDALFEINDIYEEARSADKTVGMYDEASNEELVAVKSDIVDSILHAFEKGGEQSKASKNYTLARADYFRNELENVIAINKERINLDRIARKLRDKKYGTFQNASEIQGTALSDLLRDLSAFNYRGTISVNNLREKVSKLLDWYNKDNPMLEYRDEANTGYYNAEVRDLLETLSQGNEKISLSEFRALYELLSYFDRFVDTYNKVWKNGKWIEAKEEAERFVQIIDKNTKHRVGFVDRFIRNGYFQLFGDPMSVARGMDYYESGFYTTMLEYLRECAVKAQIAEMEIMSDYNAFMEQNPNYLRESEDTVVKYRGKEITKQVLVSLYMTIKREHAQRGFVRNGYKYTAPDGKTVIRVPGINDTPDLTQSEIASFVAMEAETIAKNFNERDKKYIAILEEVYNNRAREIKRKRDMERLGFSNVTDGYYYPIKRSDTANSVDGDIRTELDRVSNASFNKDTVKGAIHKLSIEAADSMFRRHVRVVCQYGYIQEAIEYYDKVYHVAINDDRNDPISVATESENLWADGDVYFRDLISYIQGIRPKSHKGAGLINFVRSGYAKYQLGANPKVWVTQFSSLIAACNIIDADDIIAAAGVNTDDVDTYCKLAKLRNEDNTAAMAQGVFDRKTAAGKTENALSKVGDVLMAPIGKMDRVVIKRLYAACQVRAQKNGDGAIGTVKNKKAAGELLEKVILETQQNALGTEKSWAMRSNSEIMRTITMFSADSMKMVGRLLDSAGEFFTLRNRIAHSTGKERAAYEKRLKTVTKKLARSISVTVASAVFMVVVGMAFKWIRGREDDITIGSTVSDTFGNLLGGLPGIRDIYSVIFDGFEKENYVYSAFNDIIKGFTNTASSVWSLVTGSGSTEKLARNIKNLIYAAGQFAGVPARNIYNYIYGILKRLGLHGWIDEIFGY